MPWSERPRHFWNEYESSTEWLADGMVECVVRSNFSHDNIRLNIYSLGRTNIDDLIDTAVWEAVVERWRVLGSEATLAALRRRVPALMGD